MILLQLHIFDNNSAFRNLTDRDCRVAAFSFLIDCFLNSTERYVLPLNIILCMLNVVKIAKICLFARINEGKSTS